MIPAYLYQEYADDDNLQAFTIAQNQIATQYLLWFNTLNLPVYTGGIVAGPLLDWVAQGVYGITRPSITTGSVSTVGAMNSFAMNTVAMNSQRITSTLAQQTVDDDIFRRVLTWDLYKGDGFVFCMEWLKRRVLRFVNGANGISPTIDSTYDVSIAVSGTAFSIFVVSTPLIGATLNSLIQSGACITPFQYSFTVTAVTSLAPGFFSDGGALSLLSPPDGYPTSPTGLPVGGLYSNSGLVCVSGTTSPNPAAPPVFFGGVNAATFLILTGANLPLTNPGIGTGQLWNNSGVVSIA